MLLDLGNLGLSTRRCVAPARRVAPVLDALCELMQATGLDDKIVAPGFERRKQDVDAVGGSEEQDRRAFADLLSETLASFDAVDVGHHNVEKDHTRHISQEKMLGLLGVRHRDDAKAFGFEHFAI